MNRREKEVLQKGLDDEKKTIEELTKIYEQALMDTERKIRELSMRTDLENIQSIVYQKQYQQAIKGQLEGILEQLHSNEFATISEYLNKCYYTGYVGTMYNLAGQGIPLIFPIDQSQVAKAIQIDSKLSKPLYDSLGEDINKLKRAVRAQVSRGIANGSTWNQVAQELANRNMQNTPFSKAINNATRIARTEGHRIQNSAAMDSMKVAKSQGANVVKQWDASLDGRTRDTHRRLDGQLREIDEPFEVGGMKAMFPGAFGDPAEDCNCRCAVLQRARWALDESELETLKERAAYFGIDKTKDFEEYSEKYMNVANGLGAKIGGNGIPDHEEPKLLALIKYADKSAVINEIEKFEVDAVKEPIETACVITVNGEVYRCYGVEDRVFPDFDLKEKICGATISHNHPIDATEYSFSKDDFELFQKYNLNVLRGIDEKYTYEFSRLSDEVDEHKNIFELTEEDAAHEASITRAETAHIGYRRWLNE